MMIAELNKKRESREMKKIKIKSKLIKIYRSNNT